MTHWYQKIIQALYFIQNKEIRLQKETQTKKPENKTKYVGKTLKVIVEYLLNATNQIEITSIKTVELRKKKRGFREIIKMDHRYKLLKSKFKGEKQVLAELEPIGKLIKAL